MIIAVSMRVVSSASYFEPRDAISHDWTRLLDGLGLTPVFVPNVLASPGRYLESIHARGLILTGGDDLGPVTGEAGSEGDATERDRTERALLREALGASRPVLGVCRGMQLINVHFGGSLCRDLAPFGPHAGKSHAVDVAEMPDESHASSVVTNSYHQHGVLTSGVAPPLRVFASCGEVVEGVQHNTLPLLGVQWHPERPNPAAELDRRLLAWWLALCE